MKTFLAVIASCMIVIAFWAIMPFKSALLIGFAVFLFWCSIVGFFLKMRDNQVKLYTASVDAMKVVVAGERVAGKLREVKL